MRRQDKYPTTSTFKYENLNPRNRITEDCVIRALARFLDKSWEEVLTDLTNLAINETGYNPQGRKNMSVYLDRVGAIKHAMPTKPNGTKYSVMEFVDDHRTGTYLISIASHITVLKDGKIRDIWDVSLSQRRVGNYWTKD